MRNRKTKMDSCTFSILGNLLLDGKGLIRGIFIVKLIYEFVEAIICVAPVRDRDMILQESNLN